MNWQTQNGIVFSNIGQNDIVDLFSGRKFSYTWRHLPTGRTGISYVVCRSLKDLAKLVEAWNAKLPEIWQYSV